MECLEGGKCAGFNLAMFLPRVILFGEAALGGSFTLEGVGPAHNVRTALKTGAEATSC